MTDERVSEYIYDDEISAYCKYDEIQECHIEMEQHEITDELNTLRQQNKELIEDACNLVDCADNCADWFDALDKHNALMEKIGKK